MKWFQLGVAALAACDARKEVTQVPAHSALPLGGPQVPHANPPDVFVIVADDVGYADVSYHHPKDKQAPIPTPTLDEISAEGVRFTSLYAALTCTPSRASLLTGRYPHNTGMTFALFGMNPYGLEPAQETLPEALKDRGYQTKAVGKWHLGHAKDEHTPTRHGFDEFYGVYSGGLSSQFGTILRVSHDMHYDTSNGTRQGIVDPPGTRLHTTERFATKAIDFIAAADPEQPLFLYFAPTAAHSPLESREQDLEKCQHIKHPNRQQYCGMVVGIDEAVKNVTQAFATYRNRDVMIVFVSDNGGAPWQGGYNYPYPGIKSTPHEGGLRVPAFIKSSALPTGVQYSEMVHISDLAPTILGLVDEALPNQEVTRLGTDIDGRDLTDAIRSNEAAHEELVLHHDIYSGNTAFVKQIGADRWKIMIGPSGDGTLYPEPNEWVLANGSWLDRSTEAVQGLAPLFDHDTAFFAQELIRELRSCISDRLYGTSYGHPKVCPPKSATIKLFNLHVDPYEQHDVAEQRPEIVQQLLAASESHLKDLPFQKDCGRADLGYHTIEYPEHPGVKFHGPWIADGEDVESRVSTQFIDLELRRLRGNLARMMGVVMVGASMVVAAIVYSLVGSPSTRART